MSTVEKMIINADFSRPKETLGVTKATKKPSEVEAKSTCELYHAVNPLELRSSVQSSLYYYLHHVRKGFDDFRNVSIGRNHNKFNLKRQIKDWFKNPRATYRDYKKQVNGNKCDVIFNFFMTSPHALGIQEKLAETCHGHGLKTGIVDRSKNETVIAKFKEEFDNVFILQKIFELSNTNLLSNKSHKDIIEQCQYVHKCLKQFYLFSPNLEDYLYLERIATQIEKKASFLQILLEAASPKLVILSHGKIPEDTAMQIACDKTNTPTMLIPHGFPQRSLSPLSASFVMSYCPHHDDYLRKISLASTKIMRLGWLEPRVTLTNDFYNSSEHVKQERGKYNILFLSSLSGWDRHRCESLLVRVPDILKALNKMPEVGTINVRLRHGEYNDLVIKTLLTACAGSKLRISGIDSPITEDLKACDIVISFNSTGVLYAPYLNKKAIEIRDRQINSVWGGTVLPREQVYQIEDVFDAEDFSQFVLESPILNGESVFYNWGNELQAFSESLSKIIS